MIVPFFCSSCMHTKGERLQKVLARTGVASRREAEKMIAMGKIKVNRKIAVLGQRVTEADQIEVNNRPLKKHAHTKKEIILYHKKVGEICTRKDPENRKTVFEKLPKPRVGRWIGVGRLDINTSGLMIFTTDGDLANTLMHPSSEIDREYAVRTFGSATDEQIAALENGVQTDVGIGKFNHIVDAGGQGVNHWYHVVLKTGKNQEVRKVWEAVGLTVSRLIRVRYGPFELAKLPLGKTLRLNQSDMKFLDEYIKKCKTINQSDRQ